MHANGPWFDGDASGDEEALVQRYCTCGWLPGSIIVSSLRSRAWRDTLCASSRDQLMTGNRSHSDLLREFVHTVCSVVNRLRKVVPVDAEIGLDIYVRRTQGEVLYAGRLAEVTAAQLRRWRDHMIVSDQALPFPGTPLRAEFRYLWTNQNY